jgi:hypothetical protein
MRRSSLALVSVAGLIAACQSGPFAGRPDRGTAPEIDRSAVPAASLAAYFDTLQRLVQSGPAEQVEIVVAAQREYELAPSPSHQLRYAMALAAPGHAASDPAVAQGLLRELVASPEMLTPLERALALLELMKVDQQLLLAADNQRLQSEVNRNDRERVVAINRRLQSEIEENARLRKALDEAQAKLDAIANIERSINERNSNPEGRQP